MILKKKNLKKLNNKIINAPKKNLMEKHVTYKNPNFWIILNNAKNKLKFNQKLKNYSKKENFNNNNNNHYIENKKLKTEKKIEYTTNFYHKKFNTYTSIKRNFSTISNKHLEKKKKVFNLKINQNKYFLNVHNVINIKVKKIQKKILKQRYLKKKTKIKLNIEKKLFVPKSFLSPKVIAYKQFIKIAVKRRANCVLNLEKNSLKKKIFFLNSYKNIKFFEKQLIIEQKKNNENYFLKFNLNKKLKENHKKNIKNNLFHNKNKQIFLKFFFKKKIKAFLKKTINYKNKNSLKNKKITLKLNFILKKNKKLLKRLKFMLKCSFKSKHLIFSSLLISLIKKKKRLIKLNDKFKNIKIQIKNINNLIKILFLLIRNQKNNFAFFSNLNQRKSIKNIKRKKLTNKLIKKKIKDHNFTFSFLKQILLFNKKKHYIQNKILIKKTNNNNKKILQKFFGNQISKNKKNIIPIPQKKKKNKVKKRISVENKQKHLNCIKNINKKQKLRMNFLKNSSEKNILLNLYKKQLRISALKFWFGLTQKKLKRINLKRAFKRKIKHIKSFIKQKKYVKFKFLKINFNRYMNKYKKKRIRAI